MGKTSVVRRDGSGYGFMACLFPPLASLPSPDVVSLAPYGITPQARISWRIASTSVPHGHISPHWQNPLLST